MGLLQPADLCLAANDEKCTQHCSRGTACHCNASQRQYFGSMSKAFGTLRCCVWPRQRPSPLAGPA